MDKLPSERENGGLQAVFQSVFPITSFRNVSQLEFVDYAIGNWVECGHLKVTITSAPYAAIPLSPTRSIPARCCSKCGTYNANTPDFCNKCGDPGWSAVSMTWLSAKSAALTYSAPLKVV